MGESAISSINCVHAKWGNLTFTLNIREINDPDFELGTLVIEFSVNECRCSLKAAQEGKVLEEIKKDLADPNLILKHIPDCYSLLFEPRY